MKLCIRLLANSTCLDYGIKQSQKLFLMGFAILQLIKILIAVYYKTNVRTLVLLRFDCSGYNCTTTKGSCGVIILLRRSHGVIALSLHLRLFAVFIVLRLIHGNLAQPSPL